MKKPFGRKTLQERVRPIPNHKCELLAEIPPGINRIYQGICVEFRRKIWKWVTVDPYNPHSKKYLKSAALIHEQELYHLDKHPCIIHPFSKFRFIWEVIMIIVLLMLLFCIPLSIAKPQSDFDFLIVKLILDVICNIDIILWFFTGFYDKERQRVELHWGEIVKRYIKTFFIFDLLSSQPINLYVYLFDLEVLEILVSLYLLKIVRVPTLIRYLYHLTERLNVLTSNIKFITFTIWIGVILTWSTSITYLSTSYTISKIVERRRINSNFPMLMTTFRMSRFLNLVGITEIFNLSNVMMMYQIVFIVIGSVLQIIILAKVMQFYQKRSSSRSRYDNLCEEMGEYMKYKELSLRLKGKILRYVNFKFQKHIFREEDVLKNLSSVLRHDILLHRCQSMIEKVDLFKDLPEHVIMRIVAKLRSEIFLPSDVIVLAGYSGNAMYFIYMGTVAVYTSNGKEICHLEDGSHFGEIALIINAPRTATVIAVKECELFKLNRRDFQEAIEPYPEINKKIKNLAMSRLETTLLMMAESQEDITNQFQSTKDLEEQRRFATTESTNQTTTSTFPENSYSDNMLQRIIRSKSRKIPGHSCDLPIIPDPGTYLLYEGIFVETRRRLWKWRTIDPSSPDSKRHLKSAAMIYEEELQHMYKYSNMIHPFSKFRFFWQKIMIIVFLSLVICIPVTISDTQHSPDSLMVIHTIMSLICFIDIILWFRTGYYDVSKDKIVMKASNVAKRYVMSYFIFDLLSSQPIELYLYSVTEEYSKNHVYTAILLLKIVRIPTLVDYLNKYCERRNFFVNGIKLFSFVIWIVVILTWTTSTIFMLGHNVVGDPTLFIDIPGFPMLLTTFRVARGLTVVGVTEKINKNDMLLILEILVILMGTILNIFILAKIAQFYQKRSSSKKKYEGLLEEIHEYIKYKELPLKLKSKILRYMEFKYAQHIFREEDILNNLSSVLKNDIMIERCHSMIGKVDLFKDLPPHVLLRIVIKLRSEIFLPNDIIVLAGYPGHAMYFIYMGTVAVYTANGHEICHLEDGNHFGEIALLYNEPRVATVIAVKECEVFRLSRRDFQEALEPYPQLSKKIRQLAVNRLENTIQIMAERTESNFMIPSTIMSELKSRDFGLD